MTIYAMAIIATGLFTAIWPTYRADRIKRRMEEGDDRYFEEQRTYRAYPRMSDPKKIRLSGFVLIACGILLLAAQYFKP